MHTCQTGSLYSLLMFIRYMYEIKKILSPLQSRPNLASIYSLIIIHLKKVMTISGETLYNLNKVSRMFDYILGVLSSIQSSYVHRISFLR